MPEFPNITSAAHAGFANRMTSKSSMKDAADAVTDLKG